MGNLKIKLIKMCLIPDECCFSVDHLPAGVVTIVIYIFANWVPKKIFPCGFRFRWLLAGCTLNYLGTFPTFARAQPWPIEWKYLGSVWASGCFAGSLTVLESELEVASQCFMMTGCYSGPEQPDVSHRKIKNINFSFFPILLFYQNKPQLITKIGKCWKILIFILN